MSTIHQIQLRYDAVEDRALLRVSTTQLDEFRFWVTRRYARLLWKALTGSAARSARALTQSAPASREAVVAFEHEAAVAKADFQTRFQAERTATTPLGEAPVLLAQVKCAPLEGGLTLLGMHPVQGQGIEIRLDETLLHSLLKLLADAARAGEWDLDMQVSAPHASPTGPVN
jgi:hypothetical protein